MKKYSIFQKSVSMLLSLVLVLGMIPVYAAAADTQSTPAANAIADTRVVDPNTMNQWQDYFGPDKITTEFAGGVWTDKSVMTNADAFQAQISMDDPDNNFLVALSALAANQQIVGYASAPIDVMLVLDVSGSMQGSKATAMVQATNETIDSLLKQNNNNRVGVVLYSGNSSTNQNAGTNTATVILPLDRYTTSSTQTVGTGADRKTIPAYFTISGNTVSVASTVRNSNNQRVSGSKAVSGGTYIQNGLYQAWGEFSKVTDVKVPEGTAQAGAQRTPILVLMSDGQPTLATAAYNNVGTSERTYGDGQEKNTNWRTVFLTQLTASWVKSKMGTKYGTTPKFYTLGLGTGNSDYATAVLNPGTSYDTLDGYWDNYFNNTPNAQGNVLISGNGNNTWRVYQDSNVKAQNYSDMYKLASDTDELIKAFQQVVENIEMDSAGHVTLVESIGEDMSGYITFTDQLGIFMEVKDMKGLVLGNTLFTGYQFAEAMGTGEFGSKDAPTDLGNEFIRSVRERLGIDVITAQNLVGAAYQDGQIAYDAATGEFSNYVGWYSGDDGTFLGAWDKDTGITAEGAPAGATWINKSYLFLGEAHSSDMMHVVVLVATHIESGMQVVQYKIPASLIPKVTYEVELEGSDLTKMKSITRKEAFPLRLVYEVGLLDHINAVNVAEVVEAAVEAGYGHSHIEPDGSYAFYTNKWGHEHEGDEVDYNDPLHHEVAQSHFHPAVGNDRYYYIVDTPVYVKSGNTYVLYNGAAAPAGDGYYRAYSYYTASGYTTEYLPMSEYALEQAAAKGQQADGYWYIPEGSVFQQIDRFRMLKEKNITGTLEYYDHPVVVDVGDKYDTYAFLGNNGKMTIDPEEGIKLSKTVTEVVPGAPDTFTFHITLSQAVANPNVTDPDGNAYTGAWSVSGNVITVELKAGEQVYITGLPTGVTYTVTEAANKDYQGSSDNATGIVESNVIKPVDFVNIPKGYGNLIISKDVDHPFTNVPDALVNKEFTINVKLSGEDVANKQFAIGGTDPVEYITTDANGSFTVTLKDNGSLTVVGLPEGTTFTTTETLDADVHKGFTMDADRSTLSGTIVKDTTVQTHVVNVYKPAAPETDIQVGGKKILTDEAGAFDWSGKSFTFRLEAYDAATGAYVTLGEKQVTQGNLEYLFADYIKLDTLGTYYFKVSEVIPEERLEGMSYDATAGRFEVHVTDNDVDGVLEVDVYDFDTKASIEPVNGVITYTKDFENIHTTDATYVEFTVDKNLVDDHNTGETGAGYLFALYEVIGGQVSDTPAYSMRTQLVDGKGQATFHIPITKVGERTFIMKEVHPIDADKIPGMIYDTTEYTVVVSATAEGGKLVSALSITKDGAAVSAEDLVFTNEIDLDPVEIHPGVTKELIGRAPLNDAEFTFTMVQTDGSFATNIPGGYSSTISVGNGNKLFDPITYTQVGTYYYRVTEQIGNAGGMTYDQSVYHITVNVTVENDALQKQVSFVKVGQGETGTQTQLVKFTNTYVNTDTENVTLGGNKTLTGRDMRYGEFSFQLKEGDAVLQTVTNRADGSFVFAPITYTAEDVGTHTYTIVEVNDGKGGVAYDTTVYTVTVTVADNGLGELVVTTTGADSISFSNIYTTEPVDVTLSGTKTWYNTDLQQNKVMAGGEFTFVLYQSNKDYTTQGAQVATATNNAQGAFGFNLSYDQPGDYYYLLREQIGDADGVGYDTGVYHIKVAVYDNFEGKLVATVAEIYEEGTDNTTITFGNTYTPASTQIVIEGNKELTGRNLVDGEFDFRLMEGQTVVQTVANNGKSFAFKPITYTKSGTYTYQVVEVIPEAAVNNVYDGVKYDTAVFTVTVTVTDDGKGNLSATYAVTKEGTAAQLSFHNEYTITKFADFDISGSKSVFNNTLGEYEDITKYEGKFQFDLYDENGVRVAFAHNDALGSFSFNNIPLTTDKTTHVYTLVEHVGDLGGITYDSRVFTITVTAVDNGDGTQSAFVSGISMGGNEVMGIEFRNTYELEPVTTRFRVSKVLENKTLTAGMFQFQLLDAAGNVIQTKENLAAGDVVFDDITYTQPGTYNYAIREVVPTGTTNGITYDTHVVQVTVNVTDNGDGTMTADVTYEGLPVFTNTYTVTGNPEFSISGNKTLTGRDMKDGEFTFVLTDAAGNAVTTTNVGNGFSFNNVKLPGLGKHTFTVTEANKGMGGVTYDTSVYQISVTVYDDGMGGMAVGAPVVTRNGVAAQLSFTNTYKAEPVEYQITAEKIYNKTLADGQFTFTLTGEGQNQTKTNAADGTITFDKLTFTEAKTYTYTVQEVKGDKSYITYDNTVYTVVIEVKDNGAGQLVINSVKVNGTENGDITFTNTYTAAPTEYILNAQKNYNKPLSGGEFTFTLTGEGQNQSKTNAAGGAITFDKLTFTEAKTYTYTVQEVKGDKAYITYDETEYTVIISVVDNGEGKLVVETVKVNGAENGSVSFSNTYSTDDTEYQITAEKIYNKPLAGGEFTFTLTGEGVSQTKTNAAGGAITFDKLIFTEAKTYTYTVKEVKGDKAYITYDETEYTVTIEVVDNDEGQLVVKSVKVNGTENTPITFTNTYTAAPVEHTLSAQKNYNKPLAGGEFTFTLVGEGESQTKTNAAGGAVAFDKLTFTEAKTYIYTVKETKGDKAYITYDETEYTVKIEVVDNEQGQLVVKSVTVNGIQDAPITFTNTYTAAPTDHILTAEKTYSKELTGGEFTFELVGEGVSQTKTNAAGGAITFDKLIFTEAKTYTYTVTEQAGDKSYITYDDTVYTVSIEVADDELGQLFVKNVTVSDNKATGNSSVKFDNVYVITGNPVFSIDGIKELTGRDIVDGEFVFILTDDQGNTLETTNVGKTFSFSNVALPGLGEFTFTVTEKNTGVGTITYDETVYTVTVKVVDNNEGGMTVETPVITVNGQTAQLRFSNIYTKPDPITVDLNIEKSVTGDMSPKGFTFELVQDGKVVSTATSDSQGKAAMSITFAVEAVGTHEFLIREKNTGVEHVTYDTTTYKVKITVTETADGQLAAAVEVNDTSVQNVNVKFVNKFDPPATPETGDNTDVSALMGTMSISALAIIMLLAVLVLDRKKGKFER